MSGLLAYVKKLLPVGAEQVAAGKALIKSGAAFGVGGAILGCYMLEWKAVLQFLPYYNGKYAGSDKE